MKRMRFWTVLAVLLLSVTTVRAQWSGNVEAAGGYGTQNGLRTLEGGGKDRHFMGKSGAALGYKGTGFSWTTNLSANFESIEKEFLKGESHGGGQDQTINGLLTYSSEKPLSVSFRSDAIWVRPQGRFFSTWIQYSLDDKHAYDINTQFDHAMNLGVYANEYNIANHVIGAGLNFSRPLGRPSRELAGSLSYGHTFLKQESLYYAVDLSDDNNFWADVFRITPHSNTDELKGVLHFKDSVLTGKVKLVLDPGVRMDWSRSVHENSGATAYGKVNETDQYKWRDSTELQERFYFTSLDAQPYLAVNIVGRRCFLAADYGLTLYSRQLTDSDHKQGLQFQRPYVVGNGVFKWLMAAGHTLSMANTLSVLHPSYLQVCWYDRSGGYIDRVFRGNPQLQSNVLRGYNLMYQFQHKRFSASTTVQYIRSRNEIVQTWFREEIDGRPYQVFTWVNGADSRQLGFSYALGWNGKVMKAGLKAGFNRAWRRLRESDEAMRADDWTLSGNVSANLGKGWTVSTDATYQSAVTSFFSLFSDYCTLNAKVAKSFKKVTLYLAGRDLVDKPTLIHIESADGSQTNIEQSYNNRRLIILGCKWSF